MKVVPSIEDSVTNSVSQMQLHSALMSNGNKGGEANEKTRRSVLGSITRADGDSAPFRSNHSYGFGFRRSNSLHRLQIRQEVMATWLLLAPVLRPKLQVDTAMEEGVFGAKNRAAQRLVS